MTSRTDNDTNHARILLEGFPADLRDAVHEISRRHPHLDLHTTASNSADYDLTLICGDVANQSSVSITAVLKDSALEQLVSIENGDLRRTSRVRLLGEHLVELVNTLLGSVNDSQKLFNEGRSLEDLIHSLATQSSDGNEYLGLMLINIDWPGTESAESSDPLLSDLSAILKQRIGTAIRRYDHVLQIAAGQFAVILRNQQGYPTATADRPG